MQTRQLVTDIANSLSSEAMKKSRIEKLAPIANRVLMQQYEANGELNPDNAILRKDINGNMYIKSSYDGKVSGFGIAVALSGLLPALAMYFNESRGEIKTRPILEVIAKIIIEDSEYELLKSNNTARGLLDHAMQKSTDLNKLKKYLLEAAVALKQVVRTYNLD